mmetsp:Transcript_8421/g.12827  ORF Transcript_8421/g.12827 Transcript_8421/m.12827 type:complete len:96 (+) Transcript_8421:468-755(+)
MSLINFKPTGPKDPEENSLAAQSKLHAEIQPPSSKKGGQQLEDKFEHLVWTQHNMPFVFSKLFELSIDMPVDLIHDLDAFPFDVELTYSQEYFDK